MFTNAATRLRWVSIAEATSFLLLLGASALKHGGPQNEVGVHILGPIHGGLFLLYCLCAVQLWAQRRWRPLRGAVVLGAAFLPFAPYAVERSWLRADEAALAERSTPAPAGAGH